MIKQPKFQRELESQKGIKSAIICEGNICDIYPHYTDGEDVQFVTLIELVNKTFNPSTKDCSYDTLVYNFTDGFTDSLQNCNIAELVSFFKTENENRQRMLQQLNCESNKSSDSKNPPNHGGIKMVRDSEIIRTSMTSPSREVNGKEKLILNIIDYASHFASSPDKLNPNETTFFLNLLDGSRNAARGRVWTNTLVLIVNKLTDIPAWFYINNPNVKTITIPNPDRNARKEYINETYRFFNSNQSEEIIEAKSNFVSMTEGLKLVELDGLRRLIAKSDNPVEKAAEAVFLYKYGIAEDKWQQLRNDLTDDSIRTALRKHVKGQDNAIEKIVRTLKRAVTGLSGLQHSSFSKPRGVLFFAGPTGTGKTEAAKAITDLLFKDENAMKRFDMSEYGEAHEAQKFFGAPPGYIGYDSGGQLTNYVKNNPLSVLLFDEIEKAHPSIIDKFLQILEDGRMTDGQGQTVYFTETLIIFTSNIGISKEIYDPVSGRVVGRESIVNPDEPYDAIREKIVGAMKTFFKPEVLNRIGDNIVVFDYLKQADSEEIVISQISRINSHLMSRLGIESTLEDEAYKELFRQCLHENTRRNGGRGIGNVIESTYIDTLSEYIFDKKCQRNDKIHVTASDNKLVFERG